MEEDLFSWCCGYKVEWRADGYYCKNCNKFCQYVKTKWETEETRKLDKVIELLTKIYDKLDNRV